MESASSRRFGNICVLCSPFVGKDEKFADEAIKLGNVLARENIRLIYGGGSMGLMGAVATTTFAAGGQVLGVMPKIHQNKYGPTWGREIQVPTVQERISMMYQFADAFIILPGGLDTLEELACVASWSSTTMHRKPVGFLNVNGYFNNLFSFLDNAVENGFMFSEARRLIFAVDTIEEMLKKLQTFEYYTGKPTIQFSALGKRKREDDKRGLNLDLSL